jgi:phosphate-selective porin OprO/OprP
MRRSFVRFRLVLALSGAFTLVVQASTAQAQSAPDPSASGAAEVASEVEPSGSARAHAPDAEALVAAQKRLSADNAELRARLEKLEAARAPAAPASVSLDLAREAGSAAPRLPGTTGAAQMLRPTVLVETAYRVYPSEAEGNTGFAIERFRPGLVLAPTSGFRGVATTEFAGEHASILDAFLRVRATDWAEFTFGYSKPPMFASFTYEPVHSLPFPDQAPVVTSFRVDRDLGADVHFTPHDLPLEGWLRVGNGTGSPLGNDNALPAGYGALDLVLGRAWVGAPADRRVYGLRLGGSMLVESTRDRDGIAGRTSLGFVYFRPVVVSGLRVVAEGHAVAYVGPVRLTVEGAVARESRSKDADGNPATPRVDLDAISSYGLTTEVAWVLLGSPREVGRAPRARGSADGGWSGGAVELAARYDGMWLARRARDVRVGGSQGGALALKWWPVDFMAATLAGDVTRYEAAPLEEPDTLISWGFQARASFFWGAPSEPQRPPLRER